MPLKQKKGVRGKAKTKSAVAKSEPKKRRQSKVIPLVIETHPKNYKGYPFITLVQYRKQHFLTIVDNMDSNYIKAYVLDMCGPESVNEHTVVSVASDWYKNFRTRYPISVEFSRLNMTKQVSAIYRSFNVEFVTRVIGPAPKFPTDTVKSTKRRRRKTISSTIQVVYAATAT